MDKDYSSLFAFVKEAVLKEGGDGWGYILSGDWSVMSMLFIKDEDWFVETIYYDDECVVFSKGQESITFANKDYRPDHPDIIVTVDY